MSRATYRAKPNAHSDVSPCRALVGAQFVAYAFLDMCLSAGASRVRISCVSQDKYYYCYYYYADDDDDDGVAAAEAKCLHW